MDGEGAGATSPVRYFVMLSRTVEQAGRFFKATTHFCFDQYRFYPNMYLICFIFLKYLNSKSNDVY